MSNKEIKFTDRNGVEVPLDLWNSGTKTFKEQDIKIHLGPGKSLVVRKRIPRKLKKRLSLKKHQKLIFRNLKKERRVVIEVAEGSGKTISAKRANVVSRQIPKL